MVRSQKLSSGGKDKILDAAEQLFAAAGYHGASLRDITRAAGVELGLAPYHFGNKDELYRQVLLRRAPAMTSDLLAALNAIPQGLPGGEAVRAILKAYVAPHVDKLASDEGWRSYIRLAASAALLLKKVGVTDAAAELYGPAIECFKTELCRALPAACPLVINQYFHIFQTSLLGVALDLTETRSTSDERLWGDADLMTTVTDIFSAGFLALGN
ncbi:TetR/AcrR family transcriptional regulator [Rhizorhabdus wittichii]|uniref:TetR/AcrR family transcriptional regulator n=1 Tax=Rhizorhabdus wittichii TaxID=160791 RepID=UPI0003690E02|nr:TetR/AcrR family transcriptional regulator [Rhizorhabdus wittichii]